MANTVTYQRLRAALTVRGFGSRAWMEELWGRCSKLVTLSELLPPYSPGLVSATLACLPKPRACHPASAAQPAQPRPPPLQALGGEGQRGLAAPLVDVLFGRRAPAFAPSPPAWQPLNGGLDESQQRAVSLALAAQDVALIHGGCLGCRRRGAGWHGRPGLPAAGRRGCRTAVQAGRSGACSGLQFGQSKMNRGKGFLNPPLLGPLPSPRPPRLPHLCPSCRPARHGQDDGCD